MYPIYNKEKKKKYTMYNKGSYNFQDFPAPTETFSLHERFSSTNWKEAPTP
jgi:hypothetical protein